MTSEAANVAALAASETSLSDLSSTLQPGDESTVSNADAIEPANNTTNQELTAVNNTLNEFINDVERTNEMEEGKDPLHKMKALGKKLWNGTKKALRFGRPPRVKPTYPPLPPDYDRNLDPAYARAYATLFGFGGTQADAELLARVDQHDKRVRAEEKRMKRERREAERRARRGL